MGADYPSIHQLRAVLVLARELHFGRAAAQLYLTQPALSQQIRSLEHRLGVKLFSRTSRRVETTPVGRALLPLVKNVVEATYELRDAAHSSTDGGDVETLRIGLTDCSAALPSTRRAIATFTALHPDVELDFQVVDLVEQETALMSGKIDAAFVYLPVPDSFTTQPLSTEPRVVCLASSDPLAQQPSLRLADLAGRPVVSMAAEAGQAGQSFWAVDPRPDGTPVRYTDHRITRVESLLSAVSFDGAIAFLPAAANELYPRPDVRYLPVHDLPPCTFGVVRPDHGRSSRAIEALEGVCRSLSAEEIPARTTGPTA